VTGYYATSQCFDGGTGQQPTVNVTMSTVKHSF